MLAPLLVLPLLLGSLPSGPSAEVVAPDGYTWQRAIDFAPSPSSLSVELDLKPEDLARAQPNLADVRIIDPNGTVVPYALAASHAERWFDLELTPQPAAGRLHVSRYHLRVQATSPGTPALILPWHDLELEFSARVFSRPFMVTTPLGNDEGRKVLYAGMQRRDAGTPAPLDIILQQARAGEFTLDIEDGDQPPLKLLRGRARVFVPRLIVARLDLRTPLRLVFGVVKRAAPVNQDFEPVRAALKVALVVSLAALVFLGVRLGRRIFGILGH